jgi:hypothetical protein
LEEFSADQLFDVSIMQGSDYGTLLSADGTNIADALTGVPQGFKFVAENAIDVDSAVVLINVMKSSNTLTSKQTVNKTIQSVDNTCAPGTVTIENNLCSDDIIINLDKKVRIDDNSGCSSINGGGKSFFASVDTDIVKAGGSKNDVNVELCYSQNSHCTQVHITNYSPPYIYGICYNSGNLQGVAVKYWSDFISTSYTEDECKSIKKEIQDRIVTLRDSTRDNEHIGINFNSFAFKEELLYHELGHFQFEKERQNKALNLTIQDLKKQCQYETDIGKIRNDVISLIDWYDTDLREHHSGPVTPTGNVRRDELEAQRSQAETLRLFIKQWPDCK